MGRAKTWNDGQGTSHLRHLVSNTLVIDVSKTQVGRSSLLVQERVLVQCLAIADITLRCPMMFELSRWQVDGPGLGQMVQLEHGIIEVAQFGRAKCSEGIG